MQVIVNMQHERWILILSVSQDLETLQLWSLKCHPSILQSLMALGGGRGWWALLEWEGGMHWEAGLGLGQRRGGGWFLAREGEALVGVVKAKPRPRKGLSSLGCQDVPL